MSVNLMSEWQARLPSTIDASTARLPLNYQAAKNALERCLEIDEVKRWSDRAAALASYARQASDKSLENIAQRIHLRAVARIGELLLEIPAAPGGHSRGRYAAGRDAGLSSRTTTKALALARIPRDVRENEIERDPPPRIRALEAIAPPSTDAPAHCFRPRSPFYKQLSRTSGCLFYFCTWLRRVDAELAGELNYDERQRVLRRIEKAERWLAVLKQAIS